MDKEKQASCHDCPHYAQQIFTPKETGQRDLLILGEHPTFKESQYGFYMTRENRILLNTLKEAQKQTTAWLDFAIGCPPSQPPKAEDYDRCKQRICNIVAETKPKVIVCLGKHAARGLGIKTSSSKDHGNIYSTEIDNHEFHVVISNSLKTVYKRPGLADILKRDVAKALEICRNGIQSLDYDIRTIKDPSDILQAIKEAQDAVDKSPKKLLVSFDTETNSLKPYSNTGKVIAVSLSWAVNQGISFLLDHREAQHSPEERQNILNALEKLLSSPKALICAANAKFDYQWLKYTYGLNIPFPKGDVISWEHTIAEDKKGQYGLKHQTQKYIPELGGYDAELDHAINKAKKDLKEEHKRQIEQAIDRYIEEWLALPENERKARLESWVEKGYLPVSDVGTFSKVKEVKKGGRRIPGQAYKKSLGNALKKIPDLPFNQICLTAPPKPTFEDVPADILLKYAALDALVTRTIFVKQCKDLNKKQVTMKTICPDTDTYLYDALINYTLPLSEDIADMEIKGIRFDKEKARQDLEIIDARLKELEHSLFSIAGRRFNMSSSAPDLGKILYVEKKYPAIKHTDTGKPSTDKDTLKALFEKHKDPFLKMIVEYREIEKIRTTYIINWQKHSAADGRIHFSMNQHGTATHRLSCDKGLQNAPAYSESLGLNLKGLLLPDSDNHDLYDLDIANAEMRVLCAYSQDEALIDAFNNDKDFHSLTAAGISDYTYEQILAGKDDKHSEEYKLRQLGKKINFGTVYSMGPETLRKQLWTENRIQISEEEAEQYLEKFFRTYPGVANYIKQTEAFATKYKFVYTFTGRVRRFPLIGNDKYSKSRALRQAVNARIQTTSADIVNTNLTDLHKAIKPLGGRVILTVHDSILFQLPKGTPDVKALLDRVIIGNTRDKFPWLPVSWKYDVGRGPNYGECRPF